MKFRFLLAALFIVLGFADLSSAAEGRNPASFFQKRFSLNFRNTNLKDVLELIASKGDVRLKMQTLVEGKVTLAIKNSTLEEALQTIAEDNRLSFAIKDGVLSVQQSGDNEEASTPATASAAPSQSSGEGGDAAVSDFAYRSIPVYFASPKELVISLGKNLRRGEAITPDDNNGQLIFFGSDGTYRQIKGLIAMVDKRPPQFLIEAQIVETSKTFSREMGISFGDMTPGNGTPSTIGGGITNQGPGAPNLTLRGIFGSVDGKFLEARLTAAENSGDAKIISRPKVFTLNNRKAAIHSGLTYNVKVLTAVTGGGSGGGDTGGAAGGLRQITSGLSLDVTPTMVGEEIVRLVMRVQNSTPDTGNAVDGIPGINDNSADTTIMIKGGQTATVAGLLRNAVSHSRSGPPWLSRLPVIGWLFSTTLDKDLLTELMMFITPHIIDPTGEKPKAAQVSELSSAKPAAAVAAP